MGVSHRLNRPDLAGLEQLNVEGVGTAEGQEEAARPELQRVPERGLADHLHAGAWHQTHLEEPQRDTTNAADRLHDGVLANRQVGQRGVCRGSQGSDVGQSGRTHWGHVGVLTL